ncbi:MAG: short-chain dehydrogenase [Verrucomicrobia bacterium]|nr:short-chain dehydrogenase [Verrucomicrobiota bacterium]
MNLSGKRALVTGGAVRIGRAICEMLAARGCTVVVHYNRSRTEADELVGALVAQGQRALSVKADISTEQGCDNLIESAWDRAGGLDILVNNAAIFMKDSILAIDRKNMIAQLKVNYVAPILLTRSFAARAWQAVRTSSRGIAGKVVNLLDRRITANEPDSFSYSISKTLLSEFTLTAAREFAPYLAVNGVAPGAILPPPGRCKTRTRELAGPQLLSHKCTPGDVAAAVIFLLESDGITGQVVFVDAGQHLGGKHG